MSTEKDDQQQADDALGNVRTDYLELEVLSPSGAKILISPVSASEPVSFIKQALTDFQETAFYTSFNLTAIDDPSAGVLSDYAEISSFAKSGSMTVVVMNMEEYDVKKARYHLKRVREVILAPPINKSTSNDSTGRTPSKTTKDKKGREKNIDSASTRAVEEEKGNQSEDMPDITTFNNLLPPVEALSLGNGLDFSNFYKEVLFRTGSVNSSLKQAVKLPSDTIKSLAVSGWNPPPPERKLQGDLMYIEAITEEGTFHITAVPSGFYVSKSTRNHFDPSPAQVCHFSHELFLTLQSASPSFNAAWSSLSAISGYEGNSDRNGSGALDLFASLFVQGRGDHVSLHPQWNVPPSDLFNINAFSRTPTHTYDVSRTQDDLMDSFGADEKGVQREWNEEIQAIRELPCNDLNDKLMKSRLIYKIITEFTDACRAFVIAIADGHISPLNVADSESNYVFVYNGIFMSRAIDSKETFKLCKGDEASRKAAAQDLQNQKLIQTLDIKGLSSVLNTIIDYKGERYIGQTIIPGILSNTKNSARLMYGVLEPGKRMTVKTSGHELLKKLYEKLFIKERTIAAIPLTFDVPVEVPETVDPNQSILGKLDAEQASPIRVDDLDELSPCDSEFIPHIGPVEGKLLEGADGRMYALEILRVTPRDANFIKLPSGTGNITADLLENVDEDATTAYLLRQELISGFVESQALAKKNVILHEAAQKYRQQSELKRNAKSATDEVKSSSEAEDEEEFVDDAAYREFKNSLEEAESAVVDVPDIDPNAFFDLNVNTVDGNNEEKKSGEDTARQLASHLWLTVIPTLTKSIRMGEFAPNDCDMMVQIIHKLGINVRYLGELAKQAKVEEGVDLQNLLEGRQRIQMMPSYWLEFVEVEIIARTLKTILSSFLRSNASVSSAPSVTIASALNHIFGNVNGGSATANGTKPKKVEKDVSSESAVTVTSVSSKSKNKKKNKSQSNGASSNTVSSAVASVLTVDAPIAQPTNLASSRTEFLSLFFDTIVSKFVYTSGLINIPPKTAGGETDTTSTYDFSSFSNLFHDRISKTMLLRRVCQQVGLRVITKEYNFDSAAPFSPNDIVSLVAKVKSCEADNILEDAQHLLEKSHEFLKERNIPFAFELAQEASSIIHQIVGPLHKENLRTLDQMAGILLQADDINSAINIVGKSLTIAVQLYGLDCADALSYHNQLSIMLNEVKKPEAAIQHALTAHYLANLFGGASHPELTTILMQMSTICSEVGLFDYSVSCLLLARTRQADITKQCIIGEALAEAHIRSGSLDDALNEQRHCHKVLSELTGGDDPRVKAAKDRLEKYLRAVTQRNVLQAKEMIAANAQAQQAIDDIDLGGNGNGKDSSGSNPAAKKSQGAKKKSGKSSGRGK